MPPGSRRHWSLGLIALACMVLPSIAFAAPPGYTVVPVHTGLDFPVAFRFTPDGRLLYIEPDGRVMMFDSNADPTPSVWATIPTDFTVDRGLLGMAIHPAFADSPYVYFYHANPSPLVNRVVRLRDQGATGTSYTVIRDSIPAANIQHHGGRLAFSPDGMLWLTYGDQANSAAAQDSFNIRGKLLRFTSMGQNAPGNPFGPGIVMGVRNSFGICFDAFTGNGYFTDNGPTCDDELNLIEAGANYGWGPSDACGSQPAGTRLPLANFTPPFAPTSCVVYRGFISPQLDGNLFFGGYVDGRLRRVYFDPGSNGTEIDSIVTFHQLVEGNVLDVIVGNDGKLWFSSENAIYRVDPPAPTAVTPSSGIVRGLRIAPNPFAGSVTIMLDGRGVPERVEVIDLEGRRVRRWNAAATVQWDGKDEAGREVAAGVYMIRAFDRGRVAEGRVVKIGRRR